ncbi:MAG: cell division protein FtsZ [Geminicoccaceae bacterium]|nr:cell division protein FtsZ [Geminicoccaceae bacterium]MCX8101645.1 cell division protein FtsZ [Geminicoccaceae bacterium]MDW8370537.1 cell division protein FtsZ [Geminicoccaceae bacterium]
MTINLSIPLGEELKPKITVVGVGGAGGNAVNNMITAHLEGVEFVVCNTDAQALANCLTDRKIQLGVSITHGLGAGARPEVGRAAAEEALDEILDQLQGSHMVFITAGMGGGTGTGAAPVIARAVREQGILTVAVVTKPFHFEGAHRMRLAEQGLAELQQFVDTLIVIPNQNLFRLANEKTGFADAFRMADQVLHMGVRGVTDLMVMPGLINLDFADIRTVMSEMGKAMMGTGEASGERRAIEAAEAAINNPLLDDVSMKGARAVLINITGGYDMTLYEVDAAANRIREEVDPDANIIFGSTFDSTMEGRMRISVVATGIQAAGEAAAPAAEAAASSRGFVFPTQLHRPQPYPAGARPAGRAGETSPAAQLRSPSGEPVTIPGFAPSPAAGEPRAQRPGARQVVEPRAPSFIERMRSFGFQRSAPAAKPATPPAAEQVRVERPELVEASDIPAFLRREKNEA